MDINKFLLFFCLCVHGYAHATTESKVTDLLTLSLEELLNIKAVTIVTGKQQSQIKAPAITTVITAADIEAIGATDLDEILETVTGLHVTLSPAFNNSAYVMRGLYSTQHSEVLMLINGIPIKQLYSANRGNVWAGMPVNSISRIEIIRGAHSAVHGADAFSGVINVITKSAAEINGTEFGVKIGSFNTQNVWALHGADYDGFNVATMLEIYDTDGHEAIIKQDLQSQLDALQGTQISAAPAPMNNNRRNLDARLDMSKERWRLRAAYQIHDKIGAGVGSGNNLDAIGAYQNQRYNFDLTYHNPQVTRFWDLMLQTYVNAYQLKPDPYLQITPPNQTYSNSYRLKTGKKEHISALNINSFYSGFKQHLLRLGAGFIYSDLYDVTHWQNFGINPTTGETLPPNSDFIDYSGTPYAFINEGDRKNYYWFVQDEWKVSDVWTLTAGLRYDDYDDFGDTWNPRLALVWQVSKGLSFKALYGEAFRAPSFTELYTTITNTGQSINHNDYIALQPEKMRNLELGLSYQFHQDMRGSMNIYRYRVTDNIVFAPLDGDEVEVAQNIGKREGKGIELETYWQLTQQLSVLGNYAYQYVTDEHKHLLGAAPRDQVYLRADWQFIQHWHLNSQVNWVGKRSRDFGDPRSALDNYTSVDLTIRRKEWNKYWDFALSVRNFLNQKRLEPTTGRPVFNTNIIAIPNDIPLAERSIHVEARYQY